MLKAGQALVLHHGVKAVNKPRIQIYETTDCRQVDTFIVPDFPVDLCACCMQDVGAARADESGTEVLWVRAVWQNFSIGVGGQVLTVREQGSNRGAMAAP